MLARALRMFNEPLALLECVEHSAWRERRSAEWLTELAMLVSTIGDNKQAMELLDLAILRDPKHPPTRYFRGVVQMFFGDMDAAEQELERCIALACRLRAGALGVVAPAQADGAGQPRAADEDADAACRARHRQRCLHGVRGAQRAARPGRVRGGLAGSGPCLPCQAAPDAARPAGCPLDVRAAGALCDEHFVQSTTQADSAVHAGVHRGHASLGKHAAGTTAGRPPDGGRRRRNLLVHHADALRHRLPQ